MNFESSPHELNSAFWDEACGSTFAAERNIDLTDLENLEVFDREYFSFYPYLRKELEWVLAGSSSVLEVGIGLGSTSRFLASNSPNYLGLDIASGPCIFTKKSFDYLGLNSARIMKGSILDDGLVKSLGLFDSAIAIGSLHHTGDLERAILNLESLVKPGGRILVMVYYCFTPKRVLLQPTKAIKELLKSTLSLNPEYSWFEESVKMRTFSDSNSEGIGAPITCYTSRKFFKSRNLATYRSRLHNTHKLKVWKYSVPRNLLLRTISYFIGVNIYARGERN